MLNCTKRYISVCIFVLALIFFIGLMAFDIKNFCWQMEKRYEENIEESISVGDLYKEVSRKYQESISDNVEAKEEVAVDDRIDFYSTNPWRIKIPKLGLDAPIAEGTSQEALSRTVGHFEETDKWDGNVALAGHNRGYRCNFFQGINNLEKGDMVIYCTQKGERRYKVVVNTIIRETDWSYIEDTEDNRITLITCEKDKREYRRCIQAIEVKNI